MKAHGKKNGSGVQVAPRAVFCHNGADGARYGRCDGRGDGRCNSLGGPANGTRWDHADRVSVRGWRDVRRGKPDGRADANADVDARADADADASVGVGKRLDNIGRACHRGRFAEQVIGDAERNAPFEREKNVFA